ncbi:MAG: adenylosuccinate lyase [Planctomycetota bacterium]|jgi:adenylosuccinate lyase|nr:adenylosuccinate lyase [Planctomycetota bacterium]
MSDSQKAGGRDLWSSPLASRYASEAMRRNFSDATRHRHWRKLWLTLAECEKELGLPISDEQIASLRAHQDDLDYELADEYERKLRHDVMAHVHALGDQATAARPIIHLGATSCFVTDNSELMQIRDGLDLLRPMLLATLSSLARFAREHRDLPTLGYTHFQPAQPTTVGKRACLWIQDLVEDAHALQRASQELRFRGVKGTTGTQASYLALFDGDHEAVRRLDAMVTERMGFDRCWAVTGQTYTRKADFTVMSALAGLGQSAAKMGNDLRLLAHLKEVEEPYESGQIGSSAMPYKRNPMRSERVCALSRFVQGLLLNPAETASTQWFERTLDDSANRRLAISQAFLATDAVLQLLLNISQGLLVFPKVIERHLAAELPFMASETILMETVRRGGDRQQLHEAIRLHSVAAGARVKAEGLDNDLLDRLREDELFAAVHADLEELCDPQRFVGRAAEQVDEFLEAEVDPLLRGEEESLASLTGDVRV